MTSALGIPLWGNPLWVWCAGIGVAAATFALLLLVRRALVRRLEAVAARTATVLDVREIIDFQGTTRFDRAHFKAFGGSSPDFEVVYYVLSPDHNAYMDIQQQTNLDLCGRFRDEGIEFAFPTRTVLLQTVGAER